MKRPLLAVSAAALLSALALAPAMAQTPPTSVPENPTEEEPSNSGQITEGTWAGSQFESTDLRSGSATRTKKTVTITGMFNYQRDGDFDDRTIDQITASASDPAVEGCEPPSVGEVTMAGTPRSRTFSFDVSNTCNTMTGITVVARTTPLFGNRRTAQITSDLRFAAPSDHPATDVEATVADTETRDVEVSWTIPESPEPDTTYMAQRFGPGDDSEWVDVLASTPDAESLVDTVEDEGAYQYRVIANRPGADSVFTEDEIADVYVGVPPTTTTTAPSTSVTEPRSSATVNIPRLNTTPTRDRVSTRTNVTIARPSAPTTIDTGFEETLDYGFEDEEEPGDLAAEGQSVINSSDDDGVVGPGAAAASALVLVGWAGHILYFRRLAAQF